MTFNELQAAVTKDQVDTANDINDYLADTSVPLECNQHDIGVKLQNSIDRIHQLLEFYRQYSSQ